MTMHCSIEPIVKREYITTLGDEVRSQSKDTGIVQVLYLQSLTDYKVSFISRTQLSKSL